MGKKGVASPPLPCFLRATLLTSSLRSKGVRSFALFTLFPLFPLGTGCFAKERVALQRKAREESTGENEKQKKEKET